MPFDTLLVFQSVSNCQMQTISSNHSSFCCQISALPKKPTDYLTKSYSSSTSNRCSFVHCRNFIVPLQGRGVCHLEVLSTPAQPTKIFLSCERNAWESSELNKQMITCEWIFLTVRWILVHLCRSSSGRSVETEMSPLFSISSLKTKQNTVTAEV